MSIVVDTSDNINLQNYNGMVNSIMSRMDRTDIESDIPDFLYLAEREMERLILSPYRETTTTLTVNAATIDLPSDFKQLRSLTLATDPKRNLQQVTPSVISSNWPATTTGVPEAFAIVGETLLFAPAPDASYTANAIYIRRIPALTAANPSNWVLDANSDIYFFGALMQGFAHVGDEARATTYRAMFMEAIGQLNAEGVRHRYSASPMRLRSPVVA